MEACHNQKKNLVLYAHGELDSDSGREIENHLAKCKRCQTEYQRLSSLLGNIKETISAPDLSLKQVNSLITNIKWKLNHSKKETWWQRYLYLKPAHWLTAVAAGCILIVAAGIIGYVTIYGTKEFQPVVGQQNKDLMLNDSDLEIVKNLEFLKEMDAIQKLSQVFDLNGDFNFDGELDSDTRGMSQDAYRKYFV
jgi:hypothetical protein